MWSKWMVEKSALTIYNLTNNFEPQYRNKYKYRQYPLIAICRIKVYLTRKRTVYRNEDL